MLSRLQYKCSKAERQAKSQQTRFPHFCWHFGNLGCVRVCVSVLSITGHTKRWPPAESLQAWCAFACVSPCGYVLLSPSASTCTFIKSVCVEVYVWRMVLLLFRGVQHSAGGVMVTLFTVLFMNIVTKTWLTTSNIFHNQHCSSLSASIFSSSTVSFNFQSLILRATHTAAPLVTAKPTQLSQIMLERGQSFIEKLRLLAYLTQK